jgi:hypothetical protein
MMLYVAPSDDVNEHIDQLTRGGELVTHLWALLSHAGILQRDQPGTPPSRHPHAESTYSSQQEIFEQDAARYEGATTTLADHLATTSPARHLADNPQMSGLPCKMFLKLIDCHRHLCCRISLNQMIAILMFLKILSTRGKSLPELVRSTHFNDKLYYSVRLMP